MDQIEADTISVPADKFGKCRKSAAGQHVLDEWEYSQIDGNQTAHCQACGQAVDLGRKLA